MVVIAELGATKISDADEFVDGDFKGSVRVVSLDETEVLDEPNEHGILHAVVRQRACPLLRLVKGRCREPVRKVLRAFAANGSKSRTFGGCDNDHDEDGDGG